MILEFAHRFVQDPTIAVENLMDPSYITVRLQILLSTPLSRRDHLPIRFSIWTRSTESSKHCIKRP
jgi:hypothetical protein